ncbi:MAG: hypothetical protein ACOYX5_15365 [Actinomycetota bacterium]
MTLRDVPSGGARDGRVRRRALVLAASGVLTLGACAAPAEEADPPARAVLSAAETEESPAPPEVDPGDVQIDPAPSAGETPSGGQPWDGTAAAACEDIVGPGLAQVAQSTDAAGTTTFWTAGERWAVCDMAAGEAALVAAADGVGEFDRSALALTSAPVPGGGRHVAAGLLPWPVQELAYTFPDEHTERARFVSSEGDVDQVWWVLSYTATEGPLARSDVDAAGLEPVTVSVVGGAAEAFRFEWDELQRNE